MLDGVDAATGVGAGVGVLDGVGAATGVGAGVGVLDGVDAATGVGAGVGVPDGVGRESCCRTAFGASAAGVGVSANDASAAEGVGVFGAPHPRAASSPAAIREQIVRVMLDPPR